MEEWGSLKMTRCPKCGLLVVEGNACRACAESASVVSDRAAWERAAPTGSPAAGRLARPSPVFVLGIGGLVGLFALVLVYVFFWSGAGGLVTSPREQVYLGDLARLQSDVSLATREFLILQSVLPDIPPGVAASAVDASHAVESAALAWSDREAPSDDLAVRHEAIRENLRQLAAAAAQVRTGLQAGDAGLTYDATGRFVEYQHAFVEAATAVSDGTPEESE